MPGIRISPLKSEFDQSCGKSYPYNGGWKQSLKDPLKEKKVLYF